MDALKALLHQIYPELLADGFVESHKRLSMTELQAFGIEFGSHSVSSMLHGGDLWFKGDLETTAFELIEHGFRVGLPTRLHSPQHHLRVHHRVAVFDIVPGQQTPDGPVPEWHITDIISQTDLLRLLWAKMDILAPQDSAYDIQIAQLKAGLHRQTPELVSLSPDTPTLSALAKMHKAHVSGAAVVQHTPNGPLLGNLSASDLRGLTPERFGALALSVGAFLLYKHPKYGDDSVVKGNLTYEDALLDALPPEVKEGRWTEALAGAVQLVTCSESTTLGQIIELMVQHGVHRVYVCDPSTNSPTGVVTPTDVLRWILLY